MNAQQRRLLKQMAAQLARLAETAIALSKGKSQPPGRSQKKKQGRSIATNGEELLTSEEARSMLRVGDFKFRQILASGSLPVHRFGYRTLRFSPDDIRAYLDSSAKARKKRGIKGAPSSPAL